MKNKKEFHLIIGWLLRLLLFLWSCTPQEEDIRRVNNLQLRFSADTIRFDTVLTERATISRRLMVYNPESFGIHLDHIALQTPSGEFGLIIDGKQQNSLSNVRLLGKDSLLILIQLTINPNDSKLPFLLENYIDFLAGQTKKSVLVKAYGQNAVYIRNTRLDTAVVWTNSLPYVITDSLIVAPSARLEIAAGTKVYFDKDAYLLVKGSLQVNGMKDSLVTFSLSRQDISGAGTNFQVAAGQWKGITLSKESKNNALRFFRLTGATDGLRILTPDSVTVSYAQIYHAFGNGITAENTRLRLYNVAIGNASGYAVACAGGNYYFSHISLGAYIATDSRNNQGSGLWLSNQVTEVDGRKTPSPLSCILENSVVAGSSRITDYIRLEQIAGVPFHFQPLHCVLMSGIPTTGISTLFINTANRNTRLADSLFVRPSDMNFRIDTTRQGILTPLKNKGKVVSTISDDLDGLLRDSLPDIGAYEWKMLP